MKFCIATLGFLHPIQSAVDLLKQAEVIAKVV